MGRGITIESIIQAAKSQPKRDAALGPRADAKLKEIDRELSSSVVNPETGVRRHKGGRLIARPAWGREEIPPDLQAALRTFASAHTGLVEEAATTLQTTSSRLTEEELKDRVTRGLGLAWGRYLGATDPKAAWQAATAFGIFMDKWRLLQGQPTQITEERRWERVELLQRIQAVLTSRAETVDKRPRPLEAAAGNVILSTNTSGENSEPNVHPA